MTPTDVVDARATVRRPAAGPGALLSWVGRDDRRTGATIFVAALLLRLVVSFLVLGADFVHGPDSGDYLGYASRLLQGHGFSNADLEPTAYRPVAYPAFVAAVWSVAGDGNLAALKAVESVIGATTCVLLFLLGTTLYGRRAGVTAGVVAAGYPFMLYYVAATMTENLFVFLMVLSALLLHRAVARGSPATYALAGLALGATTLTRATTLLMPPFIAVWALLATRSWRRAGTATALVLCAMLVVVAPWTVRNAVALGDVVTVSTNGGLTFWGIHNPVVLATDVARPSWRSYEELPHHDELSALSETEREQRAYQLGFEALRERPSVIPRLVMGKLARFWSVLPEIDAPRRLLSAITYGPVLVLAIAGLWFDRRRLGERIHVWFIVLMVISVVVYTGSVRNRFVLEPFLVLVAAHGVVELWDRLGRGRAHGG